MKINDFEIVKVGALTVGEALKKVSNVATKEDVEWLLEHREEIPKEWQDYLLFTNWRHPDYPGLVCYVYWHDDRWDTNWGWLVSGGWRDGSHVLCRVSSETRTLGSSDTKILGTCQKFCSNCGKEVNHK